MLDIADLWTTLSTGGERPFLIRASGAVSYNELRGLVSRAFSSLGARGVSSGDRVAVILQDEAKASAAFAASLLKGLVPVMLPHDIGKPRLEAIKGAIEPRVIIQDDAIFDEGEDVPVRPPDIGRDMLAYLLFTSGTTAAPSGVEITRGNLCSHLETLIRLFELGPGTRIFNPTPIAHTDGLIFGPLVAMASGGTMIRPGPLQISEIDSWLNMMRRHSATYMMTNPTVLSIIDRSVERQDYFGFDSFRGIICSGSNLRPELWAGFVKRFGTQIWNLYGLTETVTTALYAGRHPEMGPVGSLGRPIDCEARIAPPLAHMPAAGDNIGELQLRGPHIFRGYWKNPERTAVTFTPEGWMRTGDLVQRSDDGSYMFLGRIKAAINSGGTLIRGEEIDECMLRNPVVAESVTVGLPDDEFEEIAVSAVVLKRPSDEAELTRHCRAELEALKVPKRILVVDSIPRGDAGKPNLQAVRDLLAGLLRTTGKVDGDAVDEIEGGTLELAALVFGVSRDSLSLASTPATVEGWDSFRHVNLTLQAEDYFSVRIPGTLMGKIASLGDLASLVRNLKTGQPV